MVTTRSRLRTMLLLPLTLVLTVLGAATNAPDAHADDTEATKVLLLLDVSGSMNERIAGGGTKFAAAKKALKQVASSLPAGTQVGLRVYGSEIAEPKAQNPRACRDTQLVLPIGPLDQGRMNRAVDLFTAKGETPIAYSIGKSVDDLGTSGKRVLVLISDGEESCGGDPCPAARKLAGTGVDLQFNAIGLAVGSKARSQLQCIADAGNGSYYDAEESSELSDAVRKITQRALRPFQVSGTPVDGSEDDSAAPAITAGQYTDRYQPTNTPRYYRIDRTPGSTVTASATSIVKPYQGQTTDFWELGLTTPTGERCDSTAVNRQTFRSVSLVSGAVRSSRLGTGSGTASTAVDACASGPLLLSLKRNAPGGTTRAAPVEIVVSEEATITNLAELPPAVEDYTGKASAPKATKPVRPVLGGTSFANAAELRAGSWSDSVTVGETVLYKVRLETGQRLRATLAAPAPGAGLPFGGADAVGPFLTLYSASRALLTEVPGVLMDGRPASLTAATPQVRVRNRENQALTRDPVGASAVAGDYYVAVQLDPGQAELAGRVVPIQLNLAVDGQPDGAPQYAVATEPESSASPSSSGTPTPSPSPPGGSATAAPQEKAPGLSRAVVAAAGTVAALGLLAAVVAVLVRRRSAGSRR